MFRHQDVQNQTSKINFQNKTRPNETSKLSPRLRAATHMRSAALGGFEPSQATSANPTCWGRARGCGAICCSMGCLGSSASPNCWGCTRGSEGHGPERFWTLSGKTSASPTCWGCPRGSKGRGPERFWTLSGKTSACPTCWGSVRDGAAICCSMSCLGTSASPNCWGCTCGCAAICCSKGCLGASEGSSCLEVRGPGRFRTLPGKTSANPTCWGCPRGSGRRWSSAGLLGGHPRDISGPGLLEWLAGHRTGLRLGSELSPHIGRHNLNEGRGSMR